LALIFYTKSESQSNATEEQEENTMSLTRSMLKSMALTDEQQNAIIEAHTETVNALKAERDQYKADAEKLPEVQKQLDKANADLKAADSDGYKAKYEAEKAAHDKLKTETAEEKTRTAKESALREALKAAGYAESGIKKILKYGGLTASVELDESGKIKNAEALMKSADDEWSEYKGKQEPAAASAANPPESNPKKEISAQATEAAKIFAELHAAQYGAEPTKEGKT
jgi:hypothetical protein